MIRSGIDMRYQGWKPKDFFERVLFRQITALLRVLAPTMQCHATIRHSHLGDFEAIVEMDHDLEHCVGSCRDAHPLHALREACVQLRHVYQHSQNQLMERQEVMVS